MDWQKIGHLLNIAEKAHQWPQLHKLRNAALDELEKHMGEIKPPPATTPVEVPDEPVKEPELNFAPAAKRRTFTDPDTAEAKDE